jgi:hypothetical protein
VEKGTEFLDVLFRDKREFEVITTSLLTFLEVTSVATRLRRAGNISQNANSHFIAELSRDFKQTIIPQSITDASLLVAIDVITGYGLRAPDAIPLSSALSIQAQFSDQAVYFVCTDAKLKNACISRGL